MIADVIRRFGKPPRRSGPRRVVVHCGPHKTASTYLQAVCRENADHLRESGVFFDQVTPYPAHHELAWSVLRSEDMKLRALLNAVPDDCSDLFISSEDLENLLVNHGALKHFEAALAKDGIEEIDYYFVMRSAGERFGSLMSEMSKHKTYLDWFSAFDEVMRTGTLTVNRSPKEAGGIPGGWSFVFDFERHFADFERISKGNLHTVPFDSDGPFPGCLVLNRAFATRSFAWLEELNQDNLDKWRNPRRDIAYQQAGYTSTILSNLSLASSNKKMFEAALEDRIPPKTVRDGMCLEIESLFPVFGR